MGAAFAQGVTSAGVVAASDVTLSDVDSERLAELASRLGVRTTADNAAAASVADVVMLVVKPWLAKEVLAGIRDEMSPDKLLISVVAGLKIEAIESALPPGAPVIRSMPNTPCRIGQGATGFSCGTSAKDRHVEVAGRIFNSVGLSFEVPEKMLNAVTGLSGIGPGMVYLMIELFRARGVRGRLPRDVALNLARRPLPARLNGNRA